MNLLKSIYINVFLFLGTGIALYSAYQIQHFGFHLGWLGPLLSSAPTVGYIMILLAFEPTARTSRRFHGLAILGVVGMLLAFFSWHQGATTFLPPLLAATGVVSFLLYDHWYAVYGPRGNSKIEIGKALPKFFVTNTKGEDVSSSAWLTKPSVLLFFRGNWCPLCMAQVKEIAGQYREFHKRGIRVALISPQPHANTVKLAQKFDVHLEFYTDTDNRAAKSLGLEDRFGLPLGMQALGYNTHTVLPTVVITNSSGMVIWLHETDTYRVRPEPSTFLQVLKEHHVIES